jgi:hypothetical protein
MAIERVILCGRVSEGNYPLQDERPLRLRLRGPARNVHLILDDLSRDLWQTVPPALLDLIEIATYVYVADQAILRGSANGADLGENWRRCLFFRFPVRRPELWASQPVCRQLTATLSFLSEDRYFFAFEPSGAEQHLQAELNFANHRLRGVVREVVMFSGGLDSTGGTVQEAVVGRRPVLLVHHRSTTKLNRRHQCVLQGLRQHAQEAPPFFLPVRINKQAKLTFDYTQRTRSFLYAALGATVAHLLGLDRLRFYENGIVSLNLPPSPQVVGARATRTTHPQFLNGFSELMRLLLDGRPFTVENPFWTRTKADVVRLIAEAGCCDLVEHTTSCTRTRQLSDQHTHCGACSQCIDRRFAVLAAGLEDYDPGNRYGVDLLVGERPEGEPRTMLAAYLETANQITRMTPLQFFTRFGEASRVLRHLGDDPEATALQVFRLHQNHAREVTKVIDVAFGRYAAAFRRRELPASCLLRLVSDQGPAVEVASPTPAPQAATPALGQNIFRRNGRAWDVRFGGGKLFILLPSRGAAYLHLLISRSGRSFTAVELRCQATRRREQYALGDTGENSDQQALADYRARVQELRQDLETARRNNDSGWQELIRQEMADLAAEVQRAGGLGGRLRQEGGRREQIRQSVGVAVRRVLREIGESCPALVEHFRNCLHLGYNPIYNPAQEVCWDTTGP